MAESYETPDYKKYKFKELKSYASTEWLADNKKKYRQVFDRYEVSYIYAELSFYNKLFDQDDWEVNIELKCFQLQTKREEICSLKFERKVSKYDNVVYVREGWGNKLEGKFWKKGTYYWEAWIEGEKAATKYFYVEEVEEGWTADNNPYLDVHSIKLYEGPYDDVNEDDRIYYKDFSAEETRYIYVEVMMRNKHLADNWQCELYIKFYNNARELKGQVVRLKRIEQTDGLIKFTAGWGSNVKGSWRKDRYTTEIVFLENVMAIVPFEVDEEFEEGNSLILMPDRHTPMILNPEDDVAETFEEVLQQLDNMIGLQEIKQRVRDNASYIQFLQLRKEKGFEEKEEINVHSVFIGNPGTGKTTVAGMMGKLYKKMGLLSKGHVHEADRVDLVGEYIGQTAPKVKEAIEKARGGVLFIDEAYSLARSNDDSKDFGREVIEILVKEMSNGKGDMAVIVAGYPKEMKHFLDSNPGLKSRFKFYFEFSDYLPQELSNIADFACIEKEVVLNKTSKLMIDEIILNAYRERDRSFGNARFVFDLIEKAKINLGLRVMGQSNPKELSHEEMELIIPSDIGKINIKKQKELPNIPVDEKYLQDALDELNKLIGIKNIKKQINELVRLVRFNRYTKKDVLNNFFLHTVFIGNPGTGKTTVARILTKIYKALGVLERGHMIETDRQGLVAGFVGQTAIKTAGKLDEAIGGVLFIDEAYALAQHKGGAHGDFGDEAIQTILKRMEDDRGRFFVFVAGYPDNMDDFLNTNPGLKSRFDKILSFEDYSPSELLDIALLMFNEKSIIVSPDAKDHLTKYLAFVHEYRDKYFGNARTVRNVVNDAIRNQNLRLSDLTDDQQKEQEHNLLLLEDVLRFKLDKSDFVFNRKRIGFGK